MGSFNNYVTLVWVGGGKDFVTKRCENLRVGRGVFHALLRNVHISFCSVFLTETLLLITGSICS